MDPLNLSVPEQHDYSDPTVERDENRLREWLTNLPLMDVVETVRLVVGALRAMNEQKLDVEDRFRFLEIYRETGHRLLITVDPLHLRQLALTRAQKEEATAGVEQLLLDIAAGYKLIVMTLHEKPAGESLSVLFGYSLNRAMELMGLALLESYRFYCAADREIVSEINQLYRAARYHGLLAVSVSNESGQEDDERAARISDLYHGHLLLSLTDPFRLAEGEVGLLADVLMQHAGLCRIIPGHEPPRVKEGMFWVDLYGEDTPVPCTQQAAAGDIRDPYLLDAQAALQAVREQLEKTPEKVRQQSPEALVLRRLLPEQPGSEGRREERHPDNRSVSVVTGLERIHDYMTAIARGKGDAGNGDNTGAALSSCQVLDASDSGMRLVWDEGSGIDVRVGELFGIVVARMASAILKVAVARSVRVFREGGMELGVEIISAGGAGPVVCSQVDTDNRGVVRALFMPADEKTGTGATLFTPKGFYAEGKKLEIDVSGKRVPVRMAQRVYDSPVFDRFEYVADRSGS